MTTTSDYKEVIQEANKKASMEKFIDYLYELNFRFMEINTLKHYKKLTKDLKTGIRKFNKNCVALVRTPQIKNLPDNNSYDFNILLLMDLENRPNFTYVFIKGKVIQKIVKDWDKNSRVNFKPRKKITKYPDHMTIQDRIDFRKIEDKIKRHKELTDEEDSFYHMYNQDVEEFNRNR